MSRAAPRTGHGLAVQAHRGSPDPLSGISENTLASFARARQLGADGVELDVRLTADRGLAVHHDCHVADGILLADVPAKDLPASVPLLPEVLEECGESSVNIEIKNLPTEPRFDPDEGAARLLGALLAAVGQAERFVVSSFWLPSLLAVSEVFPTVRTGLLIPSWADPAQGLELARSSGCRALHLERSHVTSELVGMAHRGGLEVAAWTVNGALAVTSAAESGVDTVITDDVTSAFAALGRSGDPGGNPRDRVR